ncbi:uncharacterized protein LOC125215287 [Salvia hispanica]|uniref:uncharacterized protein LOC125199395 n=1 Tax=Salvia hispanica TaxID=49212 RepID=UPI0020092E47|nr:uncharacterized protein LOC125199395 [Salvia hispanica]XP_047972618.1 uncharacterized protein LOC125215287 [Salvia hispanica]
MDGKGKPPLSPRPIKAHRIAETMRSNRIFFDGNIYFFTELVRKTYKVKEKWSHEYDKSLAQLVLIKFRSSLSYKPKPLPRPPIYGSLDDSASIFASTVKVVFQVQGWWSYDYTNDLVQLAIIKLRSNKPVKPLAIKPLAVDVADKPVADKPVAVPLQQTQGISE